MWDSASISACLALQPVSVRYTVAGFIHLPTNQVSAGCGQANRVLVRRGPTAAAIRLVLWRIVGIRERRWKSRSGEAVRTIQ